MAPVLASSQCVVSASSGTTSLVSSAFTVTNGDVLVVKCVTDDQGTTITTPTAAGQTFTVRATVNQAGQCANAVYTAAVTGNPGTLTVTAPFGGVSGWRSATVERWTGAQLAATPATNATKTAAGTGGFTGSVTTVSANSAVTWCAGDHNARVPGTPGYRSGAAQDGLHDRSPTNYVAYYATQSAAAAGAQTFGLTTPATSGGWSFLAVEIQAPLTAAPADAVDVTDAAGTTWDHRQAPADSVAVTDTAGTGWDHPQAPADPVAVTDIAGTVREHAQAPADPIGVTDTAGTAVGHTCPDPDPVTVTDTVTLTLQRLQATGDALDVLDLVSARVSRYQVVIRPGWRPPHPPPRVATVTTDLQVLVAAWPYIAATTTSLGAEDACRTEAVPFTGLDLAQTCLQTPGTSLREVLAVCTAIPVDVAVAQRGALLVNSAGRCGVVVAAERVVQPAGRSYALTVTDAAWWTTGWWPGTVEVTVGGPILGRWVPPHPPWPHIYPDAGVYPDTGRTVGDGGGSTPLGMSPDTGAYPDTGRTSRA